MIPRSLVEITFSIVPSSSIFASAQNFDVVFNSQLTMAEHINSFTKDCFCQLRQFHFMRRSFVLSLRCCQNILYTPLYQAGLAIVTRSYNYDTTDRVIRRLQSILNAVVCLTVGINRYLRRNDHITSVLREVLHRCPTKQGYLL